ncbi:DsbA family protein [Myxococcota bacterium]|nr:DsbA family protein [Myxococcota bacterium]
MAGPPNEKLPGAASRQDRSPRERELQRLAMLSLFRLRRLDARRRELVRQLTRRPHVLHFFHQVDDPYSHLALAAIPRLAERYEFELHFHLASATDRIHAPEPELLAAHARRDCGWIAPHYGLDFPRDAPRPSAEDVRRIERVLAGRMGQDEIVAIALELGRALWWNDPAARETLVRLEQARGIGSPTVSQETAAWALETAEEEADRMLRIGSALRRKWGHYSGGTFWYAGEWYWGVDRLEHLELRWQSLGATRRDASADHAALCFPRPALDPGPIRDDGRLLLEIFPSLRSPYTAIIFERALDLAREAGVRVALRPVMPMVMRGVPAPSAKAIYIMLDAKREADRLGVPFGNMYDPIGKPVLRGFSLWPFARSREREAEYIAAFLRAAFVEGRPTGTDAGLRQVVEAAGLAWRDALPFLDSTDFQAELERNRILLYEELGLWGVPSFRLRGPELEPDLCVWGQDRLWLVAAEIRRRLARPHREPGSAGAAVDVPA